MHADVRFAPMEHRFPAQEARVLHVRKSVLDLRLTAVGEHDLLIAPAMPVSEEDSFASLTI